MSIINSNSVVSRTPGVVTRKEENRKFIVYNPATDEIHLLQPVAHAILKLCEYSCEVDKLASIASEEIPALGCEEGKMAVWKLLERLEQRKLVTISN
ncbi:hypothetical protein [Paenibacillus vini]|uniref:PqqD family protein n=1 Tax=Paenibacillus vini TaxID=1476024 RepID=A0ABQ4MD77_9BACL|nr:hypothetical protein [Paenibacillus vini]GIP53944.1 hypothetical protein J42TS3_29790 [Paenibacillus vini]